MLAWAQPRIRAQRAQEGVLEHILGVLGAGHPARVREQIGLENVVVMIPFCRTIEEADRVLDVMAKYGLRRGEHGLKVYIMVEIPSNVILAEQFARRFGPPRPFLGQPSRTQRARSLRPVPANAPLA